MSTTKLSLTCRPFKHIHDVIREASAAPANLDPLLQVNYLESYLRNNEAGARTIIVESPYIDRHWLEEFCGYYARVLDPPTSHATRLHFVTIDWDTDAFIAWLTDAKSGDWEKHEAEFSDAYLGFTVIRPLPTAPLGRTVLKTYQDDPCRCYEPAQVKHTVHLAGLELDVVGLPFQQQDQAIGACATTAVWSALAKVRRTNGERTPTPFQVTNWAIEHRLQARAFPASAGLDLDQMAEAIRKAGYEPHVFGPGAEEDTFLLALKCYIESGIPVIIRVGMKDSLEYHALTLVGFREDPHPDSWLKVKVSASHTLCSPGLTRFYAHDDRFGPYARVKYEHVEVKSENGDYTQRVLQLRPTEDGYQEVCGEMHLVHALVPLYPKLRLTAEELLVFGSDLMPPIRYLAGEDGGNDLIIRPRFYLEGDYARSLLDRQLEPERFVGFATTAFMSRYVGVISFFELDEWFCDVVFDTTDIRRGERLLPPPIRAVVCSSAELAAACENLRSSHFGDGPVIV